MNNNINSLTMSAQTKTVCIVLGAAAAVTGLCIGGYYLFKKFGPKCVKKPATQEPAEQQQQLITEGQEPETKTEEEEKKDN